MFSLMTYVATWFILPDHLKPDRFNKCDEWTLPSSGADRIGQVFCQDSIELSWMCSGSLQKAGCMILFVSLPCECLFEILSSWRGFSLFFFVDGRTDNWFKMHRCNLSFWIECRVCCAVGGELVLGRRSPCTKQKPFRSRTEWWSLCSVGLTVSWKWLVFVYWLNGCCGEHLNSQQLKYIRWPDGWALPNSMKQLTVYIFS